MTISSNSKRNRRCTKIHYPTCRSSVQKYTANIDKEHARINYLTT